MTKEQQKRSWIGLIAAFILGTGFGTSGTQLTGFAAGDDASAGCGAPPTEEQAESAEALRFSRTKARRTVARRTTPAAPKLANSDMVGMAMANNNGHVYTWLAGKTVSRGSADNLVLHKQAYGFSAAKNYATNQIAAIALSKKNQTYTWYLDGRRTVGSTSDLDRYQGPRRYTLPRGMATGDIIGMAIAKSNNRVYTWYRNGTRSVGTSLDLDRHGRPRSFKLPSGKTTADVWGMALAPNNHTYTWYKDGTVSEGSTIDLARYRQPFSYSRGKVGSKPGSSLGDSAPGNANRRQAEPQCDPNAVSVQPAHPGDSTGCKCLNGYEGDGYTCCPESMTGGTKDGKCQCDKGYEGYQQDAASKAWSGTCKDIDECANNTHDCASEANLVCNNKAGGFDCDCPNPSFTWTGTKCLLASCPPNDPTIVCDNNGNVECATASGYYPGPGFSCQQHIISPDRIDWQCHCEPKPCTEMGLEMGWIDSPGNAQHGNWAGFENGECIMCDEGTMSTGVAMSNSAQDVPCDQPVPCNIPGSDTIFDNNGICACDKAKGWGNAPHDTDSNAPSGISFVFDTWTWTGSCISPDNCLGKNCVCKTSQNVSCIDGDQDCNCNCDVGCPAGMGCNVEVGGGNQGEDIYVCGNY